MTGPELKTLATEINGGASIGDTLLFHYFNISKAFVEQRRPWVILHKTDTSKTVSAGSSSAWNTAIDLSTITDLNRFYGDYPIRVFDGSNGIDQYRQIPFEDRLRFKDANGTFAYDEANKNLYLNGLIVRAGTLWINYIYDTDDITDDDSSTWVFPSWSHPLLALLAVGMHKGGVDYDEVNARMSPDNRATAELIVKRLENWDNEKQLSVVSQHDPQDYNPGYRPGAINMHE